MGDPHRVLHVAVEQVQVRRGGGGDLGVAELVLEQRHVASWGRYGSRGRVVERGGRTPVAGFGPGCCPVSTSQPNRERAAISFVVSVEVATPRARSATT
ncbi:MAG: hypothetical protein M0Z40_08990 [Actinomycetota bacterium]|nr:hypothetical protein [Actinomycetota bacterium]